MNPRPLTLDPLVSFEHEFDHERGGRCSGTGATLHGTLGETAGGDQERRPGETARQRAHHQSGNHHKHRPHAHQPYHHSGRPHAHPHLQCLRQRTTSRIVITLRRPPHHTTPAPRPRPPQTDTLPHPHGNLAPPPPPPGRTPPPSP